MTTTIGGQPFQLSMGQPSMPQPVVELFTRNGGRKIMTQQTGVIGQQFVIEATFLSNDPAQVAGAYNGLIAAVGTPLVADFDTGFVVNRLYIQSVGQPSIRRVAGCSSIVATFTLICQIDGTEPPLSTEPEVIP